MKYEDLQRAMDIHGHDSPETANLVTRHLSDDGLVPILHLALSTMTENETADYIRRWIDRREDE